MAPSIDPCCQFLVVCLLLLATNSSHAKPTVNSEPSCSNKDTEVLILGAGMAGVSAANTLNEGGLKDFIILEGRDEIGGRMRSRVLPVTGARVELGANWIQYLDPNNLDSHPLWRLAKKCGGLDGHFEDDLLEQRLHVFDQNGVNITSSEVFLSSVQKWEEVRLKLNKYVGYRSKHHLPDITVRQALQLFRWTSKSSIDKAIEWLGYDFEMGDSVDTMSFEWSYPYYDDYMYFVTDQEVGYVKLVHCLADSFLSPLDERLHLNSVVTQIDWNPKGNCVCVTATEGVESNRYCASAAIATFSVGVLKSNLVKFNPPLPNSKRDALSKVGNGYYLKLFLEFGEVFWKDDEVDSIVHTDVERGHYIHFQSLSQALLHNPPILLSTLTGDNARRVYTLTKAHVQQEVMTVLRTIYGKSIPDPLSLTIPDWGKNPLYRGMYSNRPLGFMEADLESLKTNVSSLFFAGEALADDEGFVHSALESGEQTGRDVLKVFGL